jgi:small subunit ribosomal protein S8
MTNDLVSDMLTRIRNASLAKHSFTPVRYSKLNLAILNVLKNEGYIKNYSVEIQENSQEIIKVILNYKGWWIKKPFFSTLKRVSKPGHRIFSGYKHFNEIIDVLSYQQGIAIISTSMGIMSHTKATQLKKGGEVLCFIG